MATPIKTNPVHDAFPVTSYYDDQPVECSNGLTKREYFAALALQGLLANPACWEDRAPMIAVLCADRLIEALNGDKLRTEL